MSPATPKNQKEKAFAAQQPPTELIILDRAAVAKLFGWSERVLMRRLKAGALPPPIKGTSGQSARWDLAAIHRHIAHPCE